MDFDYFASLCASCLIALTTFALVYAGSFLRGVVLALGAFGLTLTLTLRIVHHRECALFRYYMRKSGLAKRVKRAARRTRTRHGFP
jgi:hypothetical protein